MCKFNPKNNGRRIDPCMRYFIKWLNNREIETVSCCCGHGKHPMSILVKSPDRSHIYDIFSGIVIPRKKRFYKTDREGVYYIPEIVDQNVKIQKTKQ